MPVTEDPGSGAGGTATVGKADVKPEVVTIPVSDADRAKEFCGRLGRRLGETPPGVVRFTPPAPGARSTSACTVRRPRPGRPRPFI